jgi:hypothetical protein
MAAAGAGGGVNWKNTFRAIHQAWPRDLPDDDYIINFHKGEVREVDLPADFTAQPHYHENNLNILLAAGDGMDPGFINVADFPQFHIYVCLPDDSHKGYQNPNILEMNLEELKRLNAAGEMKRIICYMNMYDDNQLNNFVTLFTNKIFVIDTLDSRFNFNKQAIPELLLRPGGTIIRPHLTDERIAAIASEYHRGIAEIRSKRFGLPFICDEGDHPLGRVPNPGEHNFRFCTKIDGLNGGRRRRKSRRNKRRKTRRTKKI